MALIGAVGDGISALVAEGSVSPDDRDHIHERLRELGGQLGWLFEELRDQLAESHNDDETLRYSDGSAVWSPIKPAGAGAPVGSAWLTSYYGYSGVWAHDLTPGAEVTIAAPP